MTQVVPSGSVTVVGAGISGLTTAYLLARSGLAVTVLESADRIGGCLRSTTLGGALPGPVDIGAEASLFRRSETQRLAAELGLDLEFPSRTHSSQVFVDGELSPIPRRTIMGVPADADELSGILPPSARARVAAEVLTAPIDDTDTSLGDFLAARLGDDLVDTLVDPLLGGVYAGRCRDLSLAAAVPALLPAAIRGTSVLETAGDLLAARDAAAASAQDEGRAPDPVFMSLRGGIAQLIPALEAAIIAAGGMIRTGASVSRITRSDDGWTVTTGMGETASANLVLATPAHVTAPLLADVVPEPARLLAEIPYATTGLVLAHIGTDAPLTGSGFLVPPNQPSFIKAATHVSNKWPWVADVLEAGTALVRLSIGRFGDTDWQRLTDDELRDRAFADWQRITGRTGDRLLAAEVHRWNDALPQYTPGHDGVIDAVDAALDQMPGLDLVGSAYRGVGIPTCIARARRVVERLLSAPLAAPEPESINQTPPRAFPMEKAVQSEKKEYE